MDLLEDLQDEGRVLYVDNYFTSPILFEDLYERGTYASGTARVNRKHYPDKKLDQDRMEKGDMVFFALTAGKWKDKRDVYFLSTVMKWKPSPEGEEGAIPSLSTSRRLSLST
jgi:hypothetical protein